MKQSNQVVVVKKAELSRAERKLARRETAHKVGYTAGEFTYGVYAVGKEVVVLTGVAGSGAVEGFRDASARDDADSAEAKQLAVA